MKLTTTRTDRGAWRLCIDGKPTSLCFAKDDAPKFGMPQEWVLEQDAEGLADEPPHYVCGGFRSKSHAIGAIEVILTAAGAVK